MNILITNDDGINSDGIFTLFEAVKELGNVTVVAPDSERSAAGHAITISDPLRVKTVNRNGKFFGYACSGTPADCVKLAVRALMKDKPDIVISGVNLGPNTGFSVLYSGTVSGATEGAILGIPAFAISLGTFDNPDFSIAAEFAKKLVVLLREKGLPKGTLLNVNIPAVKNRNDIRGIKVTTQSKTSLVEHFDKREDPRKHVYYWLTGELIELDGEEDSDIKALRDNFISISPVHCDMTNRAFIDELKKWDFERR
ncbi:MAG: 5'/3'-nucleotidase SurE [Candidatus Omnitrophota bacterium]